LVLPLGELRVQLTRWRYDKQDWFDAFITRLEMGTRQRFIVIVGFHHSGTTLVQSVLRDQGVYGPVRRGPPGYPDRPRELPLGQAHNIIWQAQDVGASWAMAKIPTVDMPAFRRTVFDVRWLAPSCTVVPCFRDPAGVALSLEGRLGGWDPARAMANAELNHRVSNAWLEYVSRRPEACVPISVEDFTEVPERHVRRILRMEPDAALPYPIRKSPNAESIEDKQLPDRRDHRERRHAQSHHPVYRITRDGWKHGTDGEVLRVLEEIRRRYGTSPRFESDAAP